jgi:hypothetical protein
VRYALSPYIKQIRFVFKGLRYETVKPKQREANVKGHVLQSNISHRLKIAIGKVERGLCLRNIGVFSCFSLAVLILRPL